MYMLSVPAATSPQNLVVVLRVTSFVVLDVARFHDRPDHLDLLDLRRPGHRDLDRREHLFLLRLGHLFLVRQNLSRDLGRLHLFEFHSAHLG